MTILKITSVDDVQRTLAGLLVKLSGGLLEEAVHHILRKAEPNRPEVPVDRTQEPLSFVHPLSPIKVLSKTVMWIMSGGGGGQIQCSKGMRSHEILPVYHALLRVHGTRGRFRNASNAFETLESATPARDMIDKKGLMRRRRI